MVHVLACQCVGAGTPVENSCIGSGMKAFFHIFVIYFSIFKEMEFCFILDYYALYL